MTKCDRCSNSASRSMTWDLGEGVSRTIWYCNTCLKFKDDPKT